MIKPRPEIYTRPIHMLLRTGRRAPALSRRLIIFGSLPPRCFCATLWPSANGSEMNSCKITRRDTGSAFKGLFRTGIPRPFSRRLADRRPRCLSSQRQTSAHEQQPELYANSQSHDASRCSAGTFEYRNGCVLDLDVPRSDFHTPYVCRAQIITVGLPTWQVEDLVKYLHLFDTRVLGRGIIFHVLASHILVNRASWPCLIIDCCSWPVSEPQS